MREVELRCERPDCGRRFEADNEADTARCPACGREHTVPSDAARTDGAGDETASETALSVPSGSTVTITITIEVEGDR